MAAAVDQSWKIALLSEKQGRKFPIFFWSGVPEPNGLLIRCPYLIITVWECKWKDSGRAIGVKLFQRARGRFILKMTAVDWKSKSLAICWLFGARRSERDEWACCRRADIFFSKTSWLGQGPRDEEEHLIVRQSHDYVFFEAKKRSGSPAERQEKIFRTKIIIYGPFHRLCYEYPDSSWCVDSLGQPANVIKKGVVNSQPYFFSGLFVAIDKIKYIGMSGINQLLFYFEP